MAWNNSFLKNECSHELVNMSTRWENSFFFNECSSGLLSKLLMVFAFLNVERSNGVSQLSTCVFLWLRFLRKWWNSWWVFPCSVRIRFFVQVQQLERPPSRAAASSLDAPQGHFGAFYSHFFPAPKSANFGRQSGAELGAHSSPSTGPAYADRDSVRHRLPLPPERT